MHFALTEDQQLLQRTADAFGARHFTGSPVDGVWRQLADLGFVGLLGPESGGSVTDACVVAEVLGRYLAPVPYVGTAIAAAAMLRYARGDAEALEELGRGEPFSVLLGRHLEEPDGEAVVAFDWTPGARGVVLGPDGTAMVHELIAPQPVDDIDPLHPLCQVQGVPASVAKSEGARRARAIAWTGTAAWLTGLADGALQQATEYAQQREQYGRPIGSFQAIQHLCADMLVDVETSRSVTYGASWAVEHAPIDEAERLASAAKSHAGAAALRTCEAGIQVLGGIGVTQEHNAHLRLRTAHLHNAAFGSAEAPLLLLADRVLQKDTIDGFA
ncbi:acyl-CoA dehydrogenase family protein [Amycolatopsis jejuensis]|uniref:acyl-CoA dehydrogenase family protein n=1 Tax=Amycolatopsis jejuensis TaxID=330084 RepID=UPI00068D7690|nr:acyl-CoA dehydrogenase family protein [Amycolatopsis jejuensis]